MKVGVRNKLSKLSLKNTWSTSQLNNDTEPEKKTEFKRNSSFQSETNIPGVSNNLYDGDACYNGKCKTCALI